MRNLLQQKITFEQVKGVGKIELDLLPDERIYTFIGENGIGKTKLLESLFTVLSFSHNLIKNKNYWVENKHLPFVKINDMVLKDGEGTFSNHNNPLNNIKNNIPFVYLSAQHRGGISKNNQAINHIGSRLDRLERYINYILEGFSYQPERIKNFNMDINIEEWVIQRAQSANPYQSKEDNREIELTTLCFLLNQIDDRIDPKFIEISGDNRVFIKIEEQKRELTELSSGFSSILKMIQAIVAGYSYFTNESQIANVSGIVLIDEIESHLHNQWQARLIPLLKKLFPNTIFFITTHSSLVISQLKHGEAYRLKRNNNGVVQTELIEYPNKASFIDLLNDAFGVDLNQLKIDSAIENGQKEAKKALLKLVQQELDNLENVK